MCVYIIYIRKALTKYYYYYSIYRQRNRQIDKVVTKAHVFIFQRDTIYTNIIVPYSCNTKDGGHANDANMCQLGRGFYAHFYTYYTKYTHTHNIRSI